jgi:hypothetical protein
VDSAQPARTLPIRPEIYRLFCFSAGLSGVSDNLLLSVIY